MSPPSRERRWRARRFGLTFGALFAILAGAPRAPAQTSASWDLSEHSLNSGGDPQNGIVLTSPSFQVTLDAIGDAVEGTATSSASWSVDGGSTSGALPPGEVFDLVFAGPTALVWSPEPSTGSYNVYRGLVSDLPALGYGTCLASGLSNETAEDTDTPPAGDVRFYLITATNRLAEEGTKGDDSSGTERPNPSPCP